jgi:DNA polymerase
LVILGEAPGADEEKEGRPFVGASGRLLRKELLPQAGLDIAQAHVLNTFLQRPPNNDLKHWTANKTELKKLGLVPQGDPLNKRYLLPEYRWQLAELDTRLRELKPDLIICLGGTALWAVSGDGAIGTHRGTFFQSRYGLAIATYHPAALLRQWSNLPLAWADLRKAAQLIKGTLPEPLTRRLYINPTWQEMGHVYAAFARDPSAPLGVDIETCPAIDQITTIAFATPTLGICIPIWDKQPGGLGNIYASVADERRAWRWIQRFARLPNPKVMQNGLYDSQYLLDAPIDIRLRNWHDDTAILHHALQPELPKALGTLASLYLNEPSWKQMRTSKKDEAKADE